MTKSRSGWVTLVAILFLLAGVWDLMIGLVGLGVSLGGGTEIENTTTGEWPTDNLEGISIALIVAGALLMTAGVGIWARVPRARVLGLILASLTVLIHITYHRLLDGWAWTEVAITLVMIYILAVKQDEFR